MKVQAVLLRCEGVENFDPLWDLIGTDNYKFFQTAIPYFTWRKHDENLPLGRNKVVGVFLVDDLGNYSYAGLIGTSWMRNYIQSIMPLLKTGYKHSFAYRLFAPPKTVEELLEKATRINHLYFKMGPTAHPEYTKGGDPFPKWGTSEKQGIKWIECPADISRKDLRQAFTDLWTNLKPDGRPWLIQPISSSAL
jgi:hypothetical protein